MAAYLIDELRREMEAKQVRSLEGKDLHYTRPERDVLEYPLLTAGLLQSQGRGMGAC
jgi:hypothetical protein